MNLSDYDRALQLSLIMLKGKTVTQELIREHAQQVVNMLTKTPGGDNIDLEILCRDLESRCSISIGDATVLENAIDHRVWLPNARPDIDWRFWRRYRRYLEETLCWSEPVVNKVDTLTDKVLEQLEDPTRDGSWDRRGAVAGHIQSGKTANYIGLICKAADAGYRLIVILAGMHKSLRSQTQIRIDEGFLGYDTRLAENVDPEKVKIGVGAFPDSEFLFVRSLTNSQDDGDFKRAVADRPGMLPSRTEPLVLVVKKNKSVLQNVLNWARYVIGQKDRTTGKVIVRDIPLLMIDDEADYASINTNPIPRDPDTGRAVDDYDVTAINGLIRKLLASFEKTAYVGYTATPFANIFISPDTPHADHGEDLFPRSFIVNLKAPSNYIGPARVFGLEGGEDAGIEDEEGLPLIRIISDYDDFIPDKHRKYHVPALLPESLKLAIRCFIISCAARMIRGVGNQHNSMLVHVTRFIAVQRLVYELVSEELAMLRRRLEFGDGDKNKRLLDELKDIWMADYVPTSDVVRRRVDDPMMSILTWDQVRNQLYPAAARIQMKLINGSAGDVLEYRDYPEGMYSIAIGGDKLSRGLTLEGLSISYYLRSSKMYDTLMQMGRWFGYRPGYLDLCRIFTSADLAEWYEHITLANEELRRELDYMADIGKTPADYGLRVRTHPAGLLVTAVNKMRSGIEMEVSFSNTISETTIFDRNPAILRNNYDVVAKMIQGLGASYERKKDNYVWRGEKADAILNLLDKISVHEDSRRARPSLVGEYIRKQLEKNELTSWTIILISQAAGNQTTYAGLSVGMTKRTPANSEDIRYCLNKGRLLSPPDEALDLLESELLRQPDGKPLAKMTPEQIRECRPKERGLMLIYLLDHEVALTNIPIPGIVLSFPKSSSVVTVKYRVNNIYWEQEFGA